jgi:hypothetical protein
MSRTARKPTGLRRNPACVSWAVLWAGVARPAVAGQAMRLPVADAFASGTAAGTAIGGVGSGVVRRKRSNIWGLRGFAGR